MCERWARQPPENGMNDVDAVMTLTSDEDASTEDQAKAMQQVVNSGQGWLMEGSFGRSMMSAIEHGHVMLGTEPKRDYYGNRIPSRTEVEPGTKGSREFVVAHHDEEWAQMLDAV